MEVGYGTHIGWEVMVGYVARGRTPFRPWHTLMVQVTEWKGMHTGGIRENFDGICGGTRGRGGGSDLDAFRDPCIKMVRNSETKGGVWGVTRCGSENCLEEGRFADMMCDELSAQGYVGGFTRNNEEGNHRDVGGVRSTCPAAVLLEED